MSSPGGTEEVGRVSIRVLPDTGGFRQRLQAALDAAEAGLEVTIPVNFDVDTAGLRAQLEALELSRITIPVNLDLDTGRFRAQLEALDRSRITIPVSLDLRDEARINAVLARLNNRAIRINVRLNGVNQAIARLTALDAIIRRLDGRRININVDVDAAGAIAQIALIEGALGGLSGSIGSIGRTGGAAFGGMQRGALLAAGALALIPPLAAAIAVAGAGITAIWGAASTAIAAIGPAVMLLAAPIAAVALGMDGIKRAAETIRPQFDALRASVASTFEQKMIPVFQTLLGLFPTLETGLKNSAVAVSFLAQSMANMLTSAPGIALIAKSFENVNFALLQMHPGIESVVQGFLLLGAQTSIFDALVKGVNTFGEEFRNSVIDTITDGSLDAAMAGLGESLAALSRAFTGLVTNGIRLFASAAPGVNAAMDSITNFFGRFNWDSLGASVSGVFQGIATAIDGIDPGTIAAIEQEFAELSTVFQSGEMQAGIQAIADAIPGAISLIGDMSKEFANIATAVGPAITALADLSTEFTNFSSSVQTSAENLGKKLGLQGPGSIGEWLLGIDESLDRAIGTLPPKTEDLGTKTGEGFEKGLTGGRRGGGGKFGGVAEEEAAKVPPAMASGLAPTAGVVESAITPATQALITSLGQMTPAAQEQFNMLGAAAQVGIAAMTQGIANGTAEWVVAIMGGMTAMQSTVTTGVTGMSTAMSTAFTTVSAAATTGMTATTQAIANGTAQWVVAIMTGMTAVNDTITTQSAQWTVAITTAVTAMQTTLTAGFAQIATGATAGMAGITLAIAAETANWVVALMTANTAMQTTVTAGFAILGAQAAVGMAAVTLAIATGTAQWVVAVMTGMTALAMTVTAGFVGLSAAATAGMMLVATAITAGIAQWQVAISTGFIAMATTMLTGFTMLAAQATAGMAQITLAISVGTAQWVVAVMTGMTALNATFVAGFAASLATVTAGLAAILAAFVVNWAAIAAATTAAMTQMNAALTAAMAQMVATSQQGWAQMVQAATDGVNQMVQAITEGAQQAQDALQTAVTAMINTLNAAVGQFRQAGVNMGAALAEGLESQVGRVQAAANRLAQAAAAATRAAAGIRSPSRVFIALGEFMGEGLAVGLRHGSSEAIREADRMTRAIVASVSGISDAVDSSWATDFNARLNAELAQHDVDPQATATVGAAPVQVVQNFNVPSAERASDKASHGMRRLGAMGLFGGS